MLSKQQHVLKCKLQAVSLASNKDSTPQKAMQGFIDEMKTHEETKYFIELDILQGMLNDGLIKTVEDIKEVIEIF